MILYLLKFMISSVVLFAFYHFWLAREKTLVFNRFYLLSALVFSLLIPFIQLDFYIAPAFYIPAYVVNSDFMNAPAFSVVEQDKATPSIQGFSFLAVLAGLYCIITALMGIRFFADLIRLVTRIYSHKKISIAEGKLVLVDAPCLPYSFFQYIFVNKKAYEKGSIDPIILKHEGTHGRQWHSIDVLFTALVQVLFWFNPIVFLYKKAILLNHEYLADAAVLAEGSNLYNYQKMLLRLISGKPSAALACNFNYSTTKKRLLMMTTENNVRKSAFKVFLLIPVLITIVTVFACSQIENIAPNQGVFSRESVKMIQLNKTSMSEFEEKFGKPNIIDVEFVPDLNAEIEYWKYKKKTQQEDYILHAQFNRSQNVIIYYMFGLHIPSNKKKLEPEDIENLRDKKVQGIKDVYGSPTTLIIEKEIENWTYRSATSKLEIIIDKETERVKEYAYRYESSDQ